MVEINGRNMVIAGEDLDMVLCAAEALHKEPEEIVHLAVDLAVKQCENECKNGTN